MLREDLSVDTKAIPYRTDLEVEFEFLALHEALRGPLGPSRPDSSLRADFAITLGNARYHYDVQCVAINKPSGREDPFSTHLAESSSSEERFDVSPCPPAKVAGVH